jgi:hypothetical protein
MTDTIAVETAKMQRREWLDTKPQDQFAGRGKFTGCRQCGNPDGMQAVHRETLMEMTDHEIRLLALWYRDRDSLTDDYLYYPCPRCNRSIVCNQPIVIPDDYVPVPTNEVLTVWRIADPMAPDYAALAAEPEAVTAGQDSRENAGI